MEHLTKEEIINKYWDDPTNLLDAVPKIMDEFANQEKRIEAINFFKWLWENYNEPHDGLPISGNRNLGGMTIYINGTEHPFEYAYSLYLQSIK